MQHTTSTYKNRILFVLLLCALLALSIKTVNANITVHDVVITDSNPAALQLSAMGHDITLNLKPSRFNQLLQDKSIIADKVTNNQPRLYQGHIVGDTQSWARITIEDGKPSGYLFYQGKLLQLDNWGRLDALINNTALSRESFVFKSGTAKSVTSKSAITNIQDNSLILFEPGGNGPGGNATSASLIAQQLLHSFSYKIDTIKFAPEPNYKTTKPINDTFVLNKDGFGTAVTRAIRMGIVIDSRFNEAHQQRGLARALTIINSVDAIYQSQLGIALIVEAVSLYDDPNTDPMRNFSGTVDQLLTSFRPIRMNDPKLPADLGLVHLFSGHRDPDRVIGLGWINTACRVDGYDVSMSTPFPFDALLTAHEVAHNLGALHDDHEQCHVDANRSASTLMWPKLSSDTTAEFSACSIRSVQGAKNASCNINNIDVAVSMNAYPTSERLRRSLVIRVHNNDSLQRSSLLTSVTEFPEGTTFSDISAGCQIDDNSAYCDHGSVGAGETHSASVTATLVSQFQEDVIAEVVPVNTSDVQTDDNRAVIKLLQFDTSTGEAVAADSTFLDDVQATPNDGIGSLSLGFLLSLALTVFGLNLVRFNVTGYQARRFTA